jgi:hypothetical protein
MRPMTSPPFLSPSPSRLLRRLFSRAPRRRNPTTPPPIAPHLGRRLSLLLPASMSSSSTRTPPESVVADADALARKVAAIRAAGAAKLQVRFLANLTASSISCYGLIRAFRWCRSLPTSTARSLGTGTTAPAGRVRSSFLLFFSSGFGG